jgi:hypothetical protein
MSGPHLAGIHVRRCGKTLWMNIRVAVSSAKVRGIEIRIDTCRGLHADQLYRHAMSAEPELFRLPEASAVAN